MNERQARFLKRHFSKLFPPVLLALFTLMILPYALRIHPSENQVQLKGHLTSIKVKTGRTPLENHLEFTIKEHPQLFDVTGLQEIDQQLFLLEKPQSIVNFTVEKIHWDMRPRKVNVTSLSSRKNTYLRLSQEGVLFQKDRLIYMLLFLCSSLAAALFLNRLKRIYIKEKREEDQGTPAFDPILLLIAQHQKISAGLLHLLGLLVLSSYLPLWFFPLAILAVGFHYFRLCYRIDSGESIMKWADEAMKFYYEQEEARKANRVTTTNPQFRKALEVILKNKENINVRNLSGQAPLHIAAVAGHVEIVDILLKAGAKVDAQDLAGLTPLMVAAKGTSLGIVLRLLEAGADVLLRTPAGDTALGFAQANPNKAILETIQQAVYQAEAKAKAASTANQG